MPAPPDLEGVVLSGCRALVTFHDQYVVEHPQPGLEGGTVEHLGAKTVRYTIQGFMPESGDTTKTELLRLSHQRATLKVPSPIEGNLWVIISGFVEQVFINHVGGREYPYYEYVIHGRGYGASGEVLLNPLSGIDWSRDLPIPIQGYSVDWSRDVPIPAQGYSVDWVRIS